MLTWFFKCPVAEKEKEDTVIASLLQTLVSGATTSRKFKDIYRHDRWQTATLKAWDPAGKKGSRKGEKGSKEGEGPHCEGQTASPAAGAPPLPRCGSEAGPSSLLPEMFAV